MKHDSTPNVKTDLITITHDFYLTLGKGDAMLFPSVSILTNAIVTKKKYKNYHKLPMIIFEVNCFFFHFIEV